MKKAVIETKHIETRFGDTVVHKDVSFTVYEGEIYGLLGGSGSGKTTLLRQMIMLSRPSNGSITVLGRNILSMTEKEAHALRTKCGVCFQFGALFTSLTVFQNIAAVLREYTDLDEEDIDRIVRAKLKMVGLEPRAGDRYPSELSGGMVKRAALARALAMDPKLLFLDEPSSGLDPVSAEAFDNLILTLKNLLGLTIVMITHDMDTIFNVLDRMAVLADGVVAAEGRLEDILKKNDHRFIKEFFGTNRALSRAERRKAPWKPGLITP
ncbi:MAG: ABC transporter ATP-binding protein [Dissulfurimicrobium sp.]|uniref:ABC transporter ATP-binding protein n=1 Tax=Dissulfurimicrobium TaxID=1769732 RepID=UPI003C7826A4